MQGFVAATPAALAAVTRFIPDPLVEVPAELGVMSSVAGAVLTTLAVGAIAVALYSERTETLIDSLLAAPVESLLWGVALLVVLFVVHFALAVAVVDVFVAVPLALVAYGCWAVGATVAYLAVADRLVGHEDGWLRPLLLAGGLSGGLTATGVGGFLGLALGVVGFGAVLRPYLR
jgi:hypothetical protein